MKRIFIPILLVCTVLVHFNSMAGAPKRVDPKIITKTVITEVVEGEESSSYRGGAKCHDGDSSMGGSFEIVESGECCSYSTDKDGKKTCSDYQDCKQYTEKCYSPDDGDSYSVRGVPYERAECSAEKSDKPDGTSDYTTVEMP